MYAHILNVRILLVCTRASIANCILIAYLEPASGLSGTA